MTALAYVAGLFTGAGIGVVVMAMVAAAARKAPEPDNLEEIERALDEDARATLASSSPRDAA